jgi:hypothetical protein
MLNRYSFIADPGLIAKWISDGTDSWKDLFTDLAVAVEYVGLTKYSQKCDCYACAAIHHRRYTRVANACETIAELLASELICDVQYAMCVVDDISGGSLVLQACGAQLLRLSFTGTHQMMPKHEYDIRSKRDPHSTPPIRVIVEQLPGDVRDFDVYTHHLGSQYPFIVLTVDDKEVYAADAAAWIMMRRVGRLGAASAFLNAALDAGLPKRKRCTPTTTSTAKRPIS